jgi:6-phosphogluconate dehydrogenase
MALLDSVGRPLPSLTFKRSSKIYSSKTSTNEPCCDWVGMRSGHYVKMVQRKLNTVIA